MIDRDTLITENIPLVHHVVNTSFRNAIRPPLISRDDLVQFGTIGLIRAADAYQPDRGAFSTLAAKYIQTEIRKSIREGHDVVHAHPALPLVYSKYSRLPTGTSIKDAAKMIHCTEAMLQLSIKAHVANERYFYNPDVVIDECQGMDGIEDDICFSLYMEHMLSSIHPRWRALIERVYINGDNVPDIAKEHGVTPQAIRYTIKRALTAMKQCA